jgi:hypothetical protein
MTPVASNPAPRNTAATVHRILYVCAARKPFTPDELTELLAKSRANNERDSITGLLLYKAGLFTQLLEGPAEAVRCCFERIVRDARHTGCTVMQECDAVERAFPDWRMGFRNLTDPAVRALPGFSDFMNTGAFTGTPGTEDAAELWKLFDFFRREM